MSNIWNMFTPYHKIFCIKTKECCYNINSKKHKLCSDRCKRGTCRDNYPYKEYKIQKVEAKDVEKYDFLLYPLSYPSTDTDSFVLYNIDSYNSISPNKGPIPHKCPEEVPIDDLFLKFVGYWIAEGSISSEGRVVFFTFNSSRMDLARFTKDYIGNILRLKATIYKRTGAHSGSVDVGCSSTVLAHIMENLCGRGADNKHIPFKLEHMSIYKKKILLDALVDTDGHRGLARKGRNTAYAAYTTISSTLAFQVRNLALQCGYFPSIHLTNAHKAKNGGHRRESFCISWMLNPRANTSYMVTDIGGKKYWALPVRSIKKFPYSGDIHNLSVENDESYITSGIAVGNCRVGSNDIVGLARFILKCSENEARKFCGVEPKTLAEWVEPPKTRRNIDKRSKLIDTMMVARWARESREEGFNDVEDRIRDWFDELVKEE